MHGLTGERTLMRIHIGERDKHHGRPLYEAIVHLLRNFGVVSGDPERAVADVCRRLAERHSEL